MNLCETECQFCVIRCATASITLDLTVSLECIIRLNVEISFSFHLFVQTYSLLATITM